MSNAYIIKTIFPLALSAAGLLSGACVAQERSAWYAGVGVAESSNSIDNGRIASGLTNGGITTGGGLVATGISDNRNSTAYALYGGYNLDARWSVEAGYFDLGKFGFTASTTPAGSLTGSLKVHGENFDLVGHTPLGSGYAAFARAGLGLAQVESDFSAMGSVHLLRSNYSKDTVGYRLGVGVSHDLTGSILIKAEADVLRVDDAVDNKENILAIGLGLIYRF